MLQKYYIIIRPIELTLTFWDIQIEIFYTALNFRNHNAYLFINVCIIFIH